MPRIEFRRGSLSEQIVTIMRQRIQAGDYPRGEKLPTEQDLIEEFGVSRTVVREAIANLKAGGLVSTRQGVGVFVQRHVPLRSFVIDDPDLKLVNEAIAVLELRVALEVEAAGLAACRRDEKHLRQMRKAMTAMVQATEAGEDAIQADLAFHRSIAEASGNVHFLQLFNYLGELLIPRTKFETFKITGANREDYLKHLNEEHAAILAAIEAKAPEDARTAMRIHLIGSKDRLAAGAAVAAKVQLA
ncbi:Predicted D-glucarate or D-galactorate regulator, GntR family [Hyphomicrobiales bacterium]|nr:Predicted D-glucarate or D-galactorate regulator, GntR family [Hyphomicrobiales bacterium]CAH1677425.1 Predicted D-glucarate or D-galactorate regulator, GntR family [Hyphomicrobiales bacterium]